MAGGAQKDEDDIISDINVTPLVDVVLVLLIILMVTANAIANNAIDMQLPEASTSTTQNRDEPETLIISLNARGDIFLGEERVTTAVLRQRAAAAKRRSRETRAIIGSDRSVSYGRIMEVMDSLRLAQIVKISFKTERPANPATPAN